MTVTLENEYRAFESLLEIGIPTPTLKVLSYSPPTPANYDVVFSLEGGSSEEENRAIVAKERSYQLLFYTADRFEAMSLHSKVEALLTETSSLRCGDRYIKINNFALSRIFTSEGGKEAFVCMVEGEYRVSRTFTEAPKMANIGASVYNEKGQANWSDVEVTAADYDDLEGSEWVNLRESLIKVAENNV